MIHRIFMAGDKENLRQTYFWTVLAGLTYAGSSFLMSMAVSHVLGAHAAGVFAIAMSIGNQLVTIGYYNMRTFQVSDVMEKYQFADYSGFRLLSILAMILVGMIWILTGGYEGEKLAAIILMGVFKTGEAVSDLLEGRYQQKERYDVSCRGVFFKTALYLLVFVGVLAISRNLLAAMAAMGIIYLVSIFVIDGVLMRSFGGFHIRFSKGAICSLFLGCMPIFLNSFCMTYIVNASKYAMDRYYSDDYLGIFNALYMMAFVVNLFSSFVLKPLITPLSIQFAKRNFSEFAAVIRRQILIITGITGLGVIGAYLLGAPVLTLLFGIDLSGYRGVLCIILVGGSFTALYQLFQYGIVIMRHQVGCLAACILVAVLTAVFTPVLVKRYDILGGALSYFCSMALMSVVLFIVFIYFFQKEKEQ